MGESSMAFRSGAIRVELVSASEITNDHSLSEGWSSANGAARVLLCEP